MNCSGPGVFAALIGLTFVGLAACEKPDVTDTDAVTEADAAFAAVQTRGEEAMGVDQYTSTHVFDALADGGRIELQRDVDDAEGVAQIRSHLQEIARAFAAGEFGTPAFVHMQSVPGTSAMAEKRAAITYAYRELPRGGELRMVTQDPQALAAIHEFMSFQRQEHHAGGREHGEHSDKDHGQHHGAARPHGAGHDGGGSDGGV